MTTTYLTNKLCSFTNYALGINDFKDTVRSYRNNNYQAMAISAGKCVAKLSLTTLAISGLTYGVYRLSQDAIPLPPQEPPQPFPKQQQFKTLLESDLPYNHHKARLLAEECLKIDTEDCKRVTHTALESLSAHNEKEAIAFANTCLTDSSPDCELVRSKALKIFLEYKGLIEYVLGCSIESKECKELTEKALPLLVKSHLDKAMAFATACIANPHPNYEIVRQQTLDLLIEQRGLIETASQCLGSDSKECQEFVAQAWPRYLNYIDSNRRYFSELEELPSKAINFVSKCFERTTETCKRVTQRVYDDFLVRESNPAFFHELTKKCFNDPSEFCQDINKKADVDFSKIDTKYFTHCNRDGYISERCHKIINKAYEAFGPKYWDTSKNLVPQYLDISDSSHTEIDKYLDKYKLLDFENNGASYYENELKTLKHHSYSISPEVRNGFIGVLLVSMSIVVAIMWQCSKPAP